MIVIYGVDENFDYLQTARPSKGESKNYSYVQVHLLPVNSAENIPNMRKAAQHSNQGMLLNSSSFLL